jgi:hypothetical protein
MAESPLMLLDANGLEDILKIPCSIHMVTDIPWAGLRPKIPGISMGGEFRNLLFANPWHAAH